MGRAPSLRLLCYLSLHSCVRTFAFYFPLFSIPRHGFFSRRVQEAFQHRGFFNRQPQEAVPHRGICCRRAQEPFTRRGIHCRQPQETVPRCGAACRTPTAEKNMSQRRAPLACGCGCNSMVILPDCLPLCLPPVSFYFFEGQAYCRTVQRERSASLQTAGRLFRRL